MIWTDFLTPLMGWKGHSTNHALNYSINHIQKALKKKKARSGNIH